MAKRQFYACDRCDKEINLEKMLMLKTRMYISPNELDIDLCEICSKQFFVFIENEKTVTPVE